MAIVTRHPFIHIFKPILRMALDDYFTNPSPKCLVQLFDAINSTDLSLAPTLTQDAKLLVPVDGSERADICEETQSRKYAQFYSATIAYKDHSFPLEIPLALFPEEAGDVSCSPWYTTSELQYLIPSLSVLFNAAHSDFRQRSHRRSPTPSSAHQRLVDAPHPPPVQRPHHEKAGPLPRLPKADRGDLQPRTRCMRPRFRMRRLLARLRLACFPLCSAFEPRRVGESVRDCSQPIVLM